MTKATNNSSTKTVRGFKDIPQIMDIAVGDMVDAVADAPEMARALTRDCLLADAMQSIATFFNDEASFTNRDGEVVTYNRLRYTQQTILDGIVWKINDERQKNAARIDQRRSELEATADDYAGGKASEAAMRKAIRALEQQQIQQGVLVDGLAQCETEYEAITGNAYVRREAKVYSAPAAKPANNALLEQARALAAVVHVVPASTDGVDGVEDKSTVHVDS